MAVTVISKKGMRSDPVLVKEQFEALSATRRAWGDANFMAYMMWILTKNPVEAADGESSTRYVPFALNRIQIDLINKLAQKNLLLKGRQMGGTTFMLLNRLLLRATTEQGFRGLFVSQKQFYANQHYLILDRARRLFGMRLPGAGDEINFLADSLNKHLLKRRLANRRELLFENLDSSVVVDTSENKEAGQGFSINAFVGSEFSRWAGNPQETLANIRGSLAPGATRDLECTANGAQGEFYRLCMQAMNDRGPYRLHFYEWYWTDEYRQPLSETERMELLYDLARIDQAVREEAESGEKNTDLTEMEREEKAVRDRALLDLEQVAWRRTQLSDDPHTFWENFPEDPQTAFLTEGNGFFDNAIMARRKRELESFVPYKMGRNEEAILFWRPRANVKYLIGADVAEGRVVSDAGDHDFSTALIIDQLSGEMVGQYRARVRPDQFATDLAALGRMYNQATIAVERNSFGTATLLFLDRNERYPNIYNHPQVEDINGNSAVSEYPGFPTTVATRPIALAYLQEFVEQNPHMVWSSTFCSEALSFLKIKNKPQAAPGAHDDMVAAAWVAYAARAYLLKFWVPVRRPEDNDEADF